MRYSSRSRCSDLAIEDLPGELARLLPGSTPTILGVGVVPEIGTFVDEALGLRIEHDTERVAVLLEAVADVEVSELGRVALPADRMTSRPVAARSGADVERHAQAVALV